MVGQRMSRVSRRFLKKIQKATTTSGLQEIASSIQLELDKRNLSYDEALMLGNILQNHADQCPGDDIVYAISDRDSYRRTLELYLRDALLTKTEQMLLWEERRRLGISQSIHDRLLQQLLTLWKRQGRKVTIESFQDPGHKGGETNA
jgi:signal transduction histidine kinase